MNTTPTSTSSLYSLHDSQYSLRLQQMDDGSYGFVTCLQASEDISISCVPALKSSDGNAITFNTFDTLSAEELSKMDDFALKLSEDHIYLQSATAMTVSVGVTGLAAKGVGDLLGKRDVLGAKWLFEDLKAAHNLHKKDMQILIKEFAKPLNRNLLKAQALTKWRELLKLAADKVDAKDILAKDAVAKVGQFERRVVSLGIESRVYSSLGHRSLELKSEGFLKEFGDAVAPQGMKDPSLDKLVRYVNAREAAIDVKALAGSETYDEVLKKYLQMSDNHLLPDAEAVDFHKHVGVHRPKNGEHVRPLYQYQEEFRVYYKQVDDLVSAKQKVPKNLYLSLLDADLQLLDLDSTLANPNPRGGITGRLVDGKVIIDPSIIDSSLNRVKRDTMITSLLEEAEIGGVSFGDMMEVQAQRKALEIKFRVARLGQFDEARAMFFEWQGNHLLSEADKVDYARDIEPFTMYSVELKTLKRQYWDMYHAGQQMVAEGKSMTLHLQEMQRVRNLITGDFGDKTKQLHSKAILWDDLYDKLYHAANDASQPQSAVKPVAVAETGSKNVKNPQHTLASWSRKWREHWQAFQQRWVHSGDSSASKADVAGAKVSTKSKQQVKVSSKPSSSGGRFGKAMPFVGWAVSFVVGVGLIVAVVRGASSKTFTDLTSFSGTSAASLATPLFFRQYGEYLFSLDPSVSLEVPSVTQVLKELSLHVSGGDTQVAKGMLLCVPSSFQASSSQASFSQGSSAAICSHALPSL